MAKSLILLIRMNQNPRVPHLQRELVHDVQNGSFRMLLLLKPTNSISQSQQQLRMSVMQAYNSFVSTVRAIVKSESVERNSGLPSQQ